MKINKLSIVLFTLKYVCLLFVVIFGLPKFTFLLIGGDNATAATSSSFLGVGSIIFFLLFLLFFQSISFVIYTVCLKKITKDKLIKIGIFCSIELAIQIFFMSIYLQFYTYGYSSGYEFYLIFFLLGFSTFFSGSLLLGLKYVWFQYVIPLFLVLIYFGRPLKPYLNEDSFFYQNYASYLEIILILFLGTLFYQKLFRKIIKKIISKDFASKRINLIIFIFFNFVLIILTIYLNNYFWVEPFRG